METAARFQPFGVEDEHGDFKYTLRQFLLMRRLHEGGDWTDVVREVSQLLRANDEWDQDELRTYRDHLARYEEQGL